MSKCRDCRYGCADGDCDKPQTNELRVLQIITLGAFVGMIVFIFFLVYLTRIKIHGVNYAPVDYFEVYNHCRKD